jgi:hypothetical protein
MRLTTGNFIFQLNTCGYSPYVTSSLTKEWVCRLQLLLVLVSAVIHRSELRGTHDHILVSQTEAPPTWRARSPYLYPPGTGWSGYTPRHWVTCSSPRTTRRATVEVFRVTVRIRFRVTLRLEIYRQSVRPSFYSFRTVRIEDTDSNSSSIVACWFPNSSSIVAGFSVLAIRVYRAVT